MNKIKKIISVHNVLSITNHLIILREIPWIN